MRHARINAIIVTMKSPEYTIIRRRDDENGNPRYSPIGYASSEQEAKTKVGIARSVKNKNEYGDILFFLKTENISNMPNEEFDVWVVTRKPKPVLIRKMPKNGLSWVDIWEGAGASARDMIDYVNELFGQKKTVKALCAAARSLCLGKDFDIF